MNGLSVALRHRFRSAFALDCHFDAFAGVSILFGPSGSGKSTVLDAIAGLIRCGEHTVRLGPEIWDSPTTHMTVQKRRIGYLMQRPCLFPNLSVAENIAFGMAGEKKNGNGLSQLTDSVGVSHLLSQRPSRLSGGEQQRVALARALAPEPKLLLLDEPFSALDQAGKSELIAYVDAWVRARHAVAIYVTHDVAEAWAIGSRAIRMESGKVVAIGDIATVLGPDRERVLASLGAGS